MPFFSIKQYTTSRQFLDDQYLVTINRNKQSDQELKLKTKLLGQETQTAQYSCQNVNNIAWMEIATITNTWKKKSKSVQFDDMVKTISKVVYLKKQHGASWHPSKSRRWDRWHAKFYQVSFHEWLTWDRLSKIR